MESANITFRCYSDPYYNRGAQYLDPEEHLLPYWGEQQLVRKCKDGLRIWT
jgi:hypothetical protein